MRSPVFWFTLFLLGKEPGEHRCLVETIHSHPKSVVVPDPGHGKFCVSDQPWAVINVQFPEGPASHTIIHHHLLLLQPQPPHCIASNFCARFSCQTLIARCFTLTNAPLLCRYLTAVAMTMAPGELPAGSAELAENIMVIALVAGLNAGAYLSWAWLFLATPKEP